MASFAILPRISDKLSQFTASEKQYIVQGLITLRNLNESDKGFIVDMFRVMADSETQAKKDILIDMISQYCYQGVTPRVFRIAQGESFCLDFTLSVGEDFTGNFLTARNAADNALLSPNNIAGDSQVDAAVQSITVNDFALATDTFYKLNYLVETDSGSAASGDAITLLTTAFLLVEGSIDAA